MGIAPKGFDPNAICLIRFSSECPVGSHQPKEGQRKCELCPAGYFQAEKGQLDCKESPAGTFTNSAGSNQFQGASLTDSLTHPC
jgi:hypothetical protein